ncbi:S41 family peptidase [Paraflavitalea speifideaquila]|uniref:S41 family peptidase n=1 Tax=Paraflavitalea speifideaquila TaxID=3076558 RepID=UPI0028EF559E|nr:S41 family peptidase [Paraflavitalea speifideiaquila]
MANLWCSSLAACYDPHTAYFPPATKESFEGHLGKKQLEFGLTLDEDKDGNAQIAALKPGSPAFQSGQLNEGDKLQSVQTDNKPAVDVSTAGAAAINQVLSAAGSGKTVLTVKKADGSTRQVTLSKQKQLTDDEEDKVKGFVLKGSKNIGYISLPAFYLDWEDEQGVNGCANDVGREIIKLKKENISGLILDLRYNGGGSLQEALELAGIFIDAGPVAQIKSRDPKVTTLKDINRGTVYDGPLLVLINGFSASASEMLAASLQDYNRALIVGATSYGKATAQEVLPLDTTIDRESYNGKAASDSYIKLTTSCLYRLTGATAQAQGYYRISFCPIWPMRYRRKRPMKEMCCALLPLKAISIINPWRLYRWPVLPALPNRYWIHPFILRNYRPILTRRKRRLFCRMHRFNWKKPGRHTKQRFNRVVQKRQCQVRKAVPGLQ